MGLKVFDICGTLYDSNTTFDFCRYRSSGLNKIALLIVRGIFFKVLNKISMVLFNYDLIRSIHIRTLRGCPPELVYIEAVKFVDEYLDNKKIHSAHAFLEKFKKDEILLVSATIDPVAKAISEKLGGLRFISSMLELSDGSLTGLLKRDLLGLKHNYIETDSVDFIITDNKSDIVLCRQAKEVVIVSKKKNLNFWMGQGFEICHIIEVF